MSGTPFAYFKMARAYENGEAKDKNFVFSPCSMQLGLSLSANGSTGCTKKEILAFLEAENLDDLNTSNESLINSFRPFNDGGATLSFVGGIWVDESYPLKPTFEDVAESIYRAKVETVDFKDEQKQNEVIFKVNQWVEEATYGLIKSLLPEDGFNEGTRVVLANALYFSGRWSTQFYKCNTKDYSFYLPDGDSVEVPFMTCSSERPIATFEEFKVLKMPYASDGYMNISMYIVLPHETDGLSSLVEAVGSDPFFTEEYLSSCTQNVPVRELRVPKFKMSYKFEASEVLKRIGLELPFSKEEAEFHEMVLNMGSGDVLSISNVRHKAYIEVDEEGTKAAAATESDGEMGFDMFAARPPPVDFVADHPFMFIIRDDNSDVVLFMGHVLNPLLE